jgi:hypothetical protein
MKKRLEGIKLTGIIYNSFVIGCLVIALTSGFKLCCK